MASLLPDRTSAKSPQPPVRVGLQGGRAQAPGQRGPEGAGGARRPRLEGGCRGETGQRGELHPGWGGRSSVLGPSTSSSGRVTSGFDGGGSLAPALTRSLTGSITPERVSL